MESQSLKLSEDYFDLHALIKKAFGLVGHEAKGRNIELITEVKNKIETHPVFRSVRGDERRY